jgi:hypothetical protein
MRGPHANVRARAGFDVREAFFIQRYIRLIVDRNLHPLTKVQHLSTIIVLF